MFPPPHLPYTQKYVKPLLSWPTEKDLKITQDDLAEQFKAAEEALEAVKSETEKIVTNLTEQSENTNKTLEALKDTVEKISEGDQKRADEFGVLKQEFDSVKSGIPRVCCHFPFFFFISASPFFFSFVVLSSVSCSSTRAWGYSNMIPDSKFNAKKNYARIFFLFIRRCSKETKKRKPPSSTNSKRK